jgi:hypothetical protein
VIKVKGEPIEWRKPVTRALKEAVTKLDASVTKSGRPRVFVTAAEKQRAYRERKRARG